MKKKFATSELIIDNFQAQWPACSRIKQWEKRAHKIFILVEYITAAMDDGNLKHELHLDTK